WCRFALDFDVAYLAEPMVNYRLHAASMTNDFTGVRALEGFRDEIRTVWRLRGDAAAGGNAAMVECCHRAIVQRYVDVLSYRAIEGSEHGMPPDEFRHSIGELAPDPELAHRIRRVVLTRMGDRCYDRGERGRAVEFYRLAQADAP